MATKKPTRKPAAKKQAPAKPKAPPPPRPPAKKAKAPKRSRVDLFVQEYLVDLNGRQAAIRAGYSPFSARQTACELLADPKVAEKVRLAMEERAERTGLTGDRVIRKLWDILEADPREFVEVQRNCCRYCYGKGHLYQYTRQELVLAEIAHDTAQQDAEEKEQFNPQGGDGFDPRKEPHPDCPECFGRGVPEVIVKDSRDISPSARALLQSVKQTRNGIEVKMHSQVDAATLLGRHLGLWNDKVRVGGDPDNPTPLQVGVVMIPHKRTDDD